MTKLQLHDHHQRQNPSPFLRNNRLLKVISITIEISNFVEKSFEMFLNSNQWTKLEKISKRQRAIFSHASQKQPTVLGFDVWQYKLSFSPKYLATVDLLANPLLKDINLNIICREWYYVLIHIVAHIVLHFILHFGLLMQLISNFNSKFLSENSFCHFHFEYLFRLIMKKLLSIQLINHILYVQKNSIVNHIRKRFDFYVAVSIMNIFNFRVTYVYSVSKKMKIYLNGQKDFPLMLSKVLAWLLVK